VILASQHVCKPDATRAESARDKKRKVRKTANVRHVLLSSLRLGTAASSHADVAKKQPWPAATLLSYNPRNAQYWTLTVAKRETKSNLPYFSQRCFARGCRGRHR